jgi:hypothetical protein
MEKSYKMQQNCNSLSKEPFVHSGPKLLWLFAISKRSKVNVGSLLSLTFIPYLQNYIPNVRTISILEYNVLFTLNRTIHSSKTLLRVVRFNVNKTLSRTKGKAHRNYSQDSTFIDFTTFTSLSSFISSS